MNKPKTILEPIGGYLLDLVAKLRSRPFIPHSLTKLHNMRSCRELSGATMAVEVGSFKGITTRRLSYIFDKVVSIEIDPVLHKEATEHCRNRTNVEIICGDGTVVLPRIAPTLKNALLFLDGHFSGAGTGQGEEPEPVLAEIDLLAEYVDGLAAVVVDDFRLFGVELGWPKKSQVLAKLESVFPESHWSICVQFDQLLIVRKRSVSGGG